MAIWDSIFNQHEELGLMHMQIS